MTRPAGTTVGGEPSPQSIEAVSVPKVPSTNVPLTITELIGRGRGVGGGREAEIGAPGW